MHEIAVFLRGFPPFDAVDEAGLESVVAATEIEFFPVGDLVLRAGESSSEHLYVVRTGHAELIDGGRVIDVLGPGDVVGLPSMLSHLPPGLDVRAAEDLLVYRIPAEAMLPLLTGRSGLRFVARTVHDRVPARRDDDRLADLGSPSLSDLARSAVVVTGDATLREVVQRMHAQDASSALVRCPDGSVGIVTDHDLRNRVLAAERDLSDPVSSVMTAGARVLPTTATADDGITVMLTHGIRHLPVVDAAGEVVGVVEEVDLLAAQARTPLRLRRRITRAADIATLVAVAADLMPVVLAEHDAGRAPERVTSMLSVLVESLVARSVEILLRRDGNPPVPFALLSTGGVARREAAPSSDLDTVLAWDGPDDDEHIRRWFRELAAEVLEVLERCGIRSDGNGVRADDPRFARSSSAWAGSIERWVSDPLEGQGDIYLAALVDARPVWGDEVWTPVLAQLEASLRSPLARRTFARVATAHRPPTGLVRDLVIDGSGEHQGTLDLKLGGLGPLVDVGRYLAAAVPTGATRTIDRIEAARTVGLMSDGDADDLRDSFLFLTEVRLDHQSTQLIGGATPDDHVAPSELSGLGRRHLRDSFRVLARAQRQVSAGLAPQQR